MKTPSTLSRRILGLTAAALIGSLGVTGVALADGDRCGGRGKMGHGGEHRIERMAKKLDLDEAQTGQLKTIMQSNRETMREQMQANHAALREQLSSVLDEEQLKTFDTMSERFKKRRGMDSGEG